MSRSFWRELSLFRGRCACEHRLRARPWRAMAPKWYRVRSCEGKICGLVKRRDRCLPKFLGRLFIRGLQVAQQYYEGRASHQTRRVATSNLRSKSPSKIDLQYFSCNGPLPCRAWDSRSSPVVKVVNLVIRLSPGATSSGSCLLERSNLREMASVCLLVRSGCDWRTIFGLADASMRHYVDQPMTGQVSTGSVEISEFLRTCQNTPTTVLMNTHIPCA
jgi:hypothetical protein